MCWARDSAAGIYGVMAYVVITTRSAGRSNRCDDDASLYGDDFKADEGDADDRIDDDALVENAIEHFYQACIT